MGRRIAVLRLHGDALARDGIRRARGLSLGGGDDGEDIQLCRGAGLYGWLPFVVCNRGDGYFIGTGEGQRIEAVYDPADGEVVRQVSSQEQRDEGEGSPGMGGDMSTHGVDVPCTDEQDEDDTKQPYDDGGAAIHAA